MPRPKLFTDQEFKREYRVSPNTKVLAKRLGCSVVTVHKYLLRTNIKSKSRLRISDTAKKIFESYQGVVTISHLASKFQLSTPAIVHHIRKAFRMTGWNYPEPQLLSLIKVVRELRKDETLFDKPGVLAEITNNRYDVVVAYLKQVWEHQNQ